MSITYSLVNSTIPGVPGKMAQVPRGQRISLTDIATQMAERTMVIEKYFFSSVRNFTECYSTKD